MDYTLNSNEYINLVEDADYIEIDPVADPTRIYDIAREGIGIKQEGNSTSTIEDAPVSQYAYQGQNTSLTPDPDRYFITISDIVGATRVITVEIGSVVTDATSYTFLIALESASYVASSGDTDEDVRDALVTAINGASWSPSVTATPVSTNRIEIETDDLLSVVTSNLSAYLYKVALYVEFALNGGPVKQYLIEVVQSGFTYPSTPSIDSSYIYTDLTLAPSGIAALMFTPGYTLVTDSTNLLGDTDITEAPEPSLPPPPGRCLYHDGRIYFGAPALTTGERIKIIVI